MSLDKLTDEEKSILLQLSYLDLPPELTVSDKSTLTINAVLIQISDNNIEVDSDRFNNIQNFLKDNPNTSLKDIKLTGYQNHNPNEANNTNGGSESGFVGYAIKDGDGNGAVLFRGSENPLNWGNLKTDWGGNLAAGISIETKQHNEALAFYEANMKNLDGDITIYGHSKGGNLGSWVFVNHSQDSNVNAYILNGAPLWWFDLDDRQKDAMKSERFTFITFNGDIVSHLGYAPYVDKIVSINKQHGDYWDPFYPHYETSGVYNKDGSFASARSAGTWGVADMALDVFHSLGSMRDYLPRQIAKAWIVIGAATLDIIYNTWQGIVAKANYVKEQALMYISKVHQAGRELMSKVENLFDTVAKHAKSFITKAIDYVTGNNFPIEPYIKVDIPRLFYYANRLRSVQRRVAQLNEMIDDLYWEAGVMGLDNVLAADIASSFDIRIPESINYLNRTAELLQQNERYLAGKAGSIRG
ncbi:DUF2974 domain-containing protein [Mesobacillus subterraneus]|uniref:Mbeg1-like protein n=1 Tax=Mesobacillus subterraneus TaxID=285983 RepID=UPI001CFE515C|nr:Mbeg1-like protein [Mesobacillus subterraneus]WLR55347.1 DUF2974 domain-containing protein [Mesobacillus subterraneus]